MNMSKPTLNTHSLRRVAAVAALLVAAIAIVTGCSTTGKIPDGEQLYTGVKKVDIKNSGSDELPDAMVTEMKEAVNVAPNNPMPFLSPYHRTPFPVGLWVYNNWSDSSKGLKGWLYNLLVSEPVLISDVKPKIRVKMIKSILDNNGYFDSRVDYSLNTDKKNAKKASITYTANVGNPYPIDSIIYLGRDDNPLCHFIDSLARKSDYLKRGERFCTDSLATLRTNIANRLRNRGYYYFRPEFLEFEADSTITPGKIALRLALVKNMPRQATIPFKTGNVEVVVLRQRARITGLPDTISAPNCQVVVMRPARLRKNLIPGCVTFRKGRLFSVRTMDRTQNRLARLGIFSGIEMNVIPRDSTFSDSTLDVAITCRFDRPMEASVEVNATSKSNSYLGPGLNFGLTHRNLFGGGEQLSVNLGATYEWQTGRQRSSVFNSYEFSLNSTLSFPRLLAPAFVRRTERELNWTRISLGAEILNRPHYFKMAQFNAGISYDWRATRHAQNSFTPLKLTYTKLLHTTSEFDSIMDSNTAIAESFKSQYIPQLSWTYTYDRFLDRTKSRHITFQLNLTEAGNVIDGIYKLCGAKGEKKLLGTPFSQFVKGQAQLVFSKRVFGRKSDNWWVSRVLIGAAHAYGNSNQVPYSEQFYIGGANSIRAFTVRSLGPGSYRAPSDQVNGYFDQTGTFKLEMNTEYRFKIAGILHGAVFLDAGNIWLLKNDPQRPGGTLQANHFLKDIALGTGIGLRVDISMMVIRGDLGYGLHAPYYPENPHYFNIRFKDAPAFHLAIGYPF